MVNSKVAKYDFRNSNVILDVGSTIFLFWESDYPVLDIEYTLRLRFKQIPKKWKVLSAADNGFPKSKWL